MKKIALFLFIAILSHYTFSQQVIIPSKSKADFVISNLGAKTKGSIRGMYGELKIAINHLENSYIIASLDPKAVRTGNEKRDKHLINEDFFDIKLYPSMIFKSTAIKMENNQLVAFGNLTIKDITKSIRVPITFENNILKGNFNINRKDYHVHNNSFLTKGIGKNVAISFIAVVK